MAASHAQLGVRYTAISIALLIAGAALLAAGRLIQTGGSHG